MNFAVAPLASAYSLQLLELASKLTPLSRMYPYSLTLLHYTDQARLLLLHSPQPSLVLVRSKDDVEVSVNLKEYKGLQGMKCNRSCSQVLMVRAVDEQFWVQRRFLSVSPLQIGARNGLVKIQGSLKFKFNPLEQLSVLFYTGYQIIALTEKREATSRHFRCDINSAVAVQKACRAQRLAVEEKLLRIQSVQEGLDIYQSQTSRGIKEIELQEDFCCVSLFDRRVLLKQFNSNFCEENNYFIIKTTVTALWTKKLEQIIVGNQSGQLLLYGVNQQHPKFRSEARHSSAVLSVSEHDFGEALLLLSTSRSELFIWIRSKDDSTVLLSLKLDIELQWICHVSLSLEAGLCIVGGKSSELTVITSSQTQGLTSLHLHQPLIISPVFSNRLFYAIHRDAGDLFTLTLDQKKCSKVGASLLKDVLWYYRDQATQLAVTGRQVQHGDVWQANDVTVYRIKENGSESLLTLSGKCLLLDQGEVLFIENIKQSERTVFVFKGGKAHESFFKLPYDLSVLSSAILLSNSRLIISACSLYLYQHSSVLKNIRKKPQKLYNLRSNCTQTLLFSSNISGIFKIFDLVVFGLLRKVSAFQSRIKSLFVLERDLLLVSDGESIKVWDEKHSMVCMQKKQKGKLFVYRSESDLILVSLNQDSLTESHLLNSNYYSINQLCSFYDFLRLKLLTDHYQLPYKQLIRDNKLNRFYFNLAVVQNNLQLLEKLIENQQLNFSPDQIFITNMSPLQYAIENEQLQLAEKMVEALGKRQCFPKLYYPLSKHVMVRYLLNFFHQAKYPQLPKYAQVINEVQMVYSYSKHSFTFDVRHLSLETTTYGQKELRVVLLGRGIDMEHQLQDLLRSIDQFSCQELLNSDCQPFLQMIWLELSTIYKVSQFLIAAVLALQVYCIISEGQAGTVSALVFTLLLLAYELLTFQGFVIHFSNVGNVIYLITIVCNITVDILLLRDEQGQVLRYVCIVLSVVRISYALKAVHQFRHFIYIFQEIVKSIIPFAVFIVCFTFLFIFTGITVSQSTDFSSQGNFAMQTVFFGNLDFKVDSFDTEQKAIYYLNSFLMQLVLGTFMLNGILVGIVTGVYDKLQQKKQLIFFNQKVKAARQTLAIRNRVYKVWAILAGKSPQKFILGVLTNWRGEGRNQPHLRPQQLDLTGKNQQCRSQEQFAEDFSLQRQLL